MIDIFSPRNKVVGFNKLFTGWMRRADGHCEWMMARIFAHIKRSFRRFAIIVLINTSASKDLHFMYLCCVTFSNYVLALLNLLKIMKTNTSNRFCLIIFKHPSQKINEGCLKMNAECRFCHTKLLAAAIMTNYLDDHLFQSQTVRNSPHYIPGYASDSSIQAHGTDKARRNAGLTLRHDGRRIQRIIARRTRFYVYELD